MNFRHAVLLALITAAAPAALRAQNSPSMNPGAVSEPSPSASGIGGFAGLGKDRPKDARTEITATKEATFDNAASVAEFIGRVVVRDPQFTLTCDRLKVILSKDRKGLESAEAIGNVVIVQENTTGSTTKAIGRAEKATYTPATGEVILRGWPSVQQGINNQVATEEGTVMVLNRSGKSTTKGGSKTVISDTSESGGAR